MKTIHKIARIAGIAAIVSAVVAPQALAVASYTSAVRIIQLSGGWNEPHLRIITDGAFHNPSGCPMTDGYIVPATLAANQQLAAMAIAAHAQQQKVMLTVEGCAVDRPKVIGITYGNLN